jgi:L-ascorbate metabolism protein UlaG (beta-lactamase superfamily)
LSSLSEFGSICEGTDGVFYLGHASILVQLNGKRILMDPIVLSEPYSGSWTFFPPQYVDESLFGVDAVVISHVHQDHFDKDFLKRLNPNCKIFVIDGRDSFNKILNSLQLGNIVFLQPGIVHEAFDGVFIYGLLHETNGVDASALVFTDKFSVYHGNDNYCSAKVIEQFHEVVHEIDVACLPYAYIHWYPFLLVEELQTIDRIRETTELIEFYMEHCIASAGILRAKVVIPFGANLVLDNGDATSKMNLAVKTPLEFLEYAIEKNPDLEQVIQPLNAGDHVVSVAKGIQLHREIVESCEQYRVRMSQFLINRINGHDGIPEDAISIEKFTNDLSLRINALESKINFEIWIELNFDSGTQYLLINPAMKIVNIKPELESRNPFYCFKLSPSASRLWVSGVSFEAIIGTRRFELLRKPDKYEPEVLKFINTLL